MASLLMLGVVALAALGICAALVLVVKSFVQSIEAKQNAWSEFASRVGGQLDSGQPLWTGQPHGVRFLHGKTPCALLIDVEMRPSWQNNNDSTPADVMRLVFELGRVPQFTCDVSPRWLPQLLAGLVGTAGVRLGWAEFDRQFVVVTNDELRAPDILNRPVQQQLLALSEAARSMLPLEKGHVTLTVRDGALEIRLRGSLERIEELWPFYQLGARLFDLLAPRV